MPYIANKVPHRYPQTNRLACLRLTERCADILLSVCQEVKEARDTVTTELEPAVTRLIECVPPICLGDAC